MVSSKSFCTTFIKLFPPIGHRNGISIFDINLSFPCSENKYVLKANWIDRTHSRNILSARITKDIYAKYDISVGGGILLYGLPGTGKTMFAQAVANEIDGYFVSIKSSDLKSKWYGDTELKIRTLFEEARKHEISVIFFDGVESSALTRPICANATLTEFSIPVFSIPPFATVTDESVVK